MTLWLLCASSAPCCVQATPPTTLVLMAAGDIVKSHPQVEEITRLVLDGSLSLFEISKRFEGLSHCSLTNYRKYHVLPALRNAQRLNAIEKATGNPAMLPDVFGGDGSMVGADATDAVREAFGAGVVLAARNRRLSELQSISDRLEQVAEGRAEELTDVAYGGESGLLHPIIKANGVEFHLDKDWVNAKLAIHQRIAQETGQWQDQSPSVTVQIVVPGHAGAAAGKIINLEPETIALPARR